MNIRKALPLLIIASMVLSLIFSANFAFALPTPILSSANEATGEIIEVTSPAATVPAARVRAVLSAGTDWWPMFRHDLYHTGASTSKGPTTNNTLWTFTTGNRVESSPAVVDGRVYVGSADDKVYCLNAADGSLVWSYKTGGYVYSSPIIVDGLVYVGSNDQKVYCLNAADGSLVWSYKTGGKVYSSPTVVDGRVYVGSVDDWQVYCLDATNGAFLWKYSAGAYVFTSPVVVGGLVIVGSAEWSHSIFCLNAANGSLVWNFVTCAGVDSSPAVVGGLVYMGTGWGQVCCLNATDGAIVGIKEDIGAFDSSPAIAGDRFYDVNEDGVVYCLNMVDGSVIWNYTTGDYVTSSPAVADSLVYLQSADGKIYCLNAADGSLVWSYKTGRKLDSSGFLYSSPAVADGVVYIGSLDGRVYAFGIPPPKITVTSPENRVYAVKRGIPLTFTIDEITSWVGYSLDGQPNATITGNTILPTLSNGVHRVTVYANNTYGKMGASATINFTVEAPPTVEGTFHFRAYIDGSDYVYIQNAGGKIWYEHILYDFPGEHSPYSPASPAATTIDGVDWFPVWNKQTNTSNTYMSSSPQKYPRGAWTVLNVTKITSESDSTQSRGPVTFENYPSSSNNYTAKVLLNDDTGATQFEGSAWYEFELSWEAPIATTVSATMDSGATVDLKIAGNVTSTQISNAAISTSQSAKTTTLSFNLTGNAGTTGFSNMTIPRSAVPYGTKPTIYINGQQNQNQGYVYDANNYYVWYTTHFSTHQISIVFTSISPSGLPLEVIYGIVAAIAVVVIVAVMLVSRKRKKAIG